METMIPEYNTLKHKAVRFENGFYGLIDTRTNLVRCAGLTFEQFLKERQFWTEMDARQPQTPANQIPENWRDAPVEEEVAAPDFSGIKFVGGGAVTATQRRYIKQGLTLTGGKVGSQWKSPKMQFELAELTKSGGKIRCWTWNSGWSGSSFDWHFVHFTF